MRTWFDEAGLKAVLATTVDMAARLDRDGVILELYSRAGFEPAPPDRRLVGQTIDAGYEAALAERCRQALAKLLLTGRAQRFSYEGEYNGRAYGRECWLTACGGDLLLLEKDATAQVLLQRQLRNLYWYDPLTGLFNRRRFEQELRYQSANASAGTAGVIVGDVDGLRLINDSLGREQGDRLLGAVADILRCSFSPETHVARIDGDEFAVILPAADEAALAAACRQIGQEIDEYNLLLPSARLSLAIGRACGSSSRLEALFGEAEQAMVRQKRLYGDSHQFILEGMFQTAQARDYFDSGHPQRVEVYALQLAAALALPLQQRENLRLLSRYHDIGTVGLDERLVLKPGRLTTEEREAIAEHCEIGCRIARCVPALAAIADFILKHHEQWDGGGYPLGLRQDAIPLECRILAIVDAYEVMTAGRPYRQALAPAAAAAELRRGAGRQFDPDLTGLFLSLLAAADEVQI